MDGCDAKKVKAGMLWWAGPRRDGSTYLFKARPVTARVEGRNRDCLSAPKRWDLPFERLDGRAFERMNPMTEF